MRTTRGWIVRVVVVPLLVLGVAWAVMAQSRRAEQASLGIVRIAALDLGARARRGEDLAVRLGASEAFVAGEVERELSERVGGVAASAGLDVVVERVSTGPVVYGAVLRADGVPVIVLRFVTDERGAVVVGYRAPE